MTDTSGRASRVLSPAALLAPVVSAVLAEGACLREEFYRPDGPRGRRGSAPIDREIEERLCAALCALLPCAFAGEETGATAQVAEPGSAGENWLWLVDPHDGTFDFIAGRRGSAISVALLRENVPVLGVVHSPLSPDRGEDTIAWAQGIPALLRNGRPISVDLSRRRLAPGELVWATASAALRPEAFSRAVAPARYVAMPSIAYRLARVAAGDGVAAISIHGVNEYDVAAGLALVRAAGGVLLDAQGREAVLTGNCEGRLSGCFAGAPEAVSQLVKFSWTSVEEEPRRSPRVALGFPRKIRTQMLARAQGCLLGQIIGDSLGSHGRGARELADGGPYHTLAGQPTDNSELALTLARSLLRERAYEAQMVLAVYREWLLSRPVDVGAATEAGLIGRPDAESRANGPLLRIAPLGIWAAGDAARAAAAARADCALTHPNPMCVEACAGYAAAIAEAVGGGERGAMLKAAQHHCAGMARQAIEQGAAGTPPVGFEAPENPVLHSLQNAFFHLMRGSFEAGLLETVAAGGDTGGNGAIAGALLGALHAREGLPPRWILPVLACRPLPEALALRPRPMTCWPDDVLELAEALLAAAG